MKKHKLLAVLLALAMTLSLLPTAALADGETEASGESATEVLTTEGTSSESTSPESTSSESTSPDSSSSDGVSSDGGSSSESPDEEPTAALAETTGNCEGSCAHAAAIGTMHYDSLADAIAEASSSNTVRLLADLDNTGDIELPAGVIFDGANHKISGDSAVYVNVAGGTVTNVNFQNIHDSNNKKSALYASYLTGTLTVTNCVFDTCDWDAIQTTPEANAVIIITGNTFRNTGEQGINTRRYVHVESEQNVDFTVTVTGNKFYDGSKLKETGLEVYYPVDASKVTLDHNFMAEPMAVCIGTGGTSYNNAATEAFPFVAEDMETEVIVVAQMTDTNGNVRLYTSLDDVAEDGAVALVGARAYKTLTAAITAAKSGDTVTLLDDVSLNSVLLIGKSITIQGNGHKIENTANRVIRITAADLDVKIYNCSILSKCTATSDVRGISFDNTSSGTSLTLDNCTVSASFYAINVAVGPENLNITIKNGTVAGGWAALNAYCNNSTITIENSTMRGLNDKGEGGWNDFATLVFDGNGLWYNENIGKYGSNNTLTIKNSTVYSSSESSNNQAWLSLQYGATGNTVIVDSASKLVDGSQASMIENLDVYSELPITNNREAPIPYDSNHLISVQASSDTYRILAPAGKQITLPAAPAKSGYRFAGWSDETSVYAAGATYTMADSENVALTALWNIISSGGSSSSGSSNTTTTTEKNPDGSTTTTTTNKTTGTVTEVTKETDGTTTTVETKKDGTVTETVKTTDGTTGTVVTDNTGDVTEVKATVSAAAAKEAGKTGGAVTLPVEVPAVNGTKDAPAVEITMSKSAGSVNVEIPVEKVTPGTVAVIVNADGTEKIVSTSVVTENGVALALSGSTTVKVFDNAKSFTDVPVTNVFYNEICSLSAREIMVGKTDEKFDLHSSVTLNQIANVAGRITGAVDVKDYNAGIAWGAENGLKGGNTEASRGDVLKALYVAAGSPAVADTSILARFKDAASIPADLTAAAAWAAQNGILKGDTSGNANLSTNVTRGQACALAGRTMGTLA